MRYKGEGEGEGTDTAKNRAAFAGWSRRDTIMGPMPVSSSSSPALLDAGKSSTLRPSTRKQNRDEGHSV